MAEHVHQCKLTSNSDKPHSPSFGCVCECQATYHHLGWQEINVLPEPE